MTQNHTQYSNLRLRDCIIRENDLIDYAIELGHEVVAITDHECISSHVKVEKYYEKIKKDNPNFKVILGNEIYLVRNGLNANNFKAGVDKYWHFILYAKNAIGHKQIREISTRAWGRSYMARGMRRVPTYYQDLIDIIGANPGHIIASSACFVAGTQVETKDGWKNIEDIKSGDFVINRYGEWEEVIEPTSMMTDQYGYNIEITGNERPIICTDNHEFLVITNNGKTPRWVQAKDLNLTACSNSKHIGLEPVNFNYNQSKIIYKKEWENSFIPKSKYSHRNVSLPDEIIITPELMRLFGLFLGDGCISLKTNPNISFSFNDKEYEVYKDSFVEQAAQQLNITWSVQKTPKQHRVEIRSSSVELVNLFFYLFGDVKADTKYIPDRLRISEELDYELMFGYMLADGYFRTRTNSGAASGYECGEFVTVSISHKLSSDVYNVLNQLHITSSISLTKEKIDKNGTHHNNAWYVSGANKVLGKINKLVPYSHSEVIKIFTEAKKAKEKDYIKVGNIWYRKIRFKKATQIELHERVYCLNNTSHSFKCENLIVHNCMGGILPTQILKAKTDSELWPKIDNWILQMVNLFGQGNFFLELQPSHNKDQIYVNKKLIELSSKLNVPYIITTDSHYLTKEDRPIHKAYLNAQNGDREVDDFYATTYLMDTEELESYFNYLTKEQLSCAYENILKIKDMCEDYSLRKPLKIPQLVWKKFEPCIDDKYRQFLYNKIPYLEIFSKSSYEGDKVLVEALIESILKDKRLQNDETYNEVNTCLEMTWVSSEINKTHWSAYYLNLQKIIDLVWEAGSLVGPGRGSGVGFILLYLLGITQINPLWETTKTYAFRFLNPSRVSVLDIDFDSEGGRRKDILKKFKEAYGENRVAGVATFGTEKSKSAILTAARGLGIDSDIAQYLSSFIPSDRGKLRTLSQCMYGDKENGFEPIKQFVYEMTNNYPELWKVAIKIEGLVCRLGSHAGGVIFKDEDFTESVSLMRTPKGEIITAFDLHDVEDCGDIKYDVLSIDALDKIHNCLDLLIQQGYIEDTGNLKENYERAVGIYNLERNSPEMWKMVWNHEIQSLFQMEQQSGIRGIELVHPKNVSELATLNSVIRLMAPEKGAEQPLDMWNRYRTNIQDWYDEMRSYGLNEDEINWLSNYPDITQGIAESQESLMRLVQEERLGGNNLNFADKCRKGLAKFLAS